MELSEFLVSEEHKAQWKSLIPEANRIKRVSADDFYRMQYAPVDGGAAQPCIVEGLDWKCFNWTPSYLAQQLCSRNHTFRYEDNETLSMPISEYISKVYEEQDPNSRQIPSLPAPPSTTETLPYARHVGPLSGNLFNEAEVELLFPDKKIEQTVRKFLFFGAASTKTNNHYDWSDNFVMCIQGIKHVCLQPPHSEQTMNISESSREKLAHGDCFFVPEP